MKFLSLKKHDSLAGLLKRGNHDCQWRRKYCQMPLSQDCICKMGLREAQTGCIIGRFYKKGAVYP